MNIEDYLFSCPSKKYLGVECLGCGAQRAIVLVFEGKFSEAFQMYPPVYTLTLFLLILSLSFIDKRRKYDMILIVLVVVNLIIMIVSYIYKNYYLMKEL